ncbi:MAG: N,N-diacetylchitobiose transport system permease protein [Actinomycetota bacterium]|jgi:ABC-type glycerol-3-phosphate transport system permease component|nr:N,N-diacetylchitobiose transport system permease protein [Actinomycetota bacterium]
MRRRPGATVALYATAAVVGLFAVAPFLWMVLTSIKPEGEILRRTPSLWTAHPQFGRYSDVLHAGFARALRNSLIVATGTTIAGVAVAALAGYALARFDLPLRRYLLLMVMGVQMFPLVVLIIPLFVVMKALGLLDSWLGLVVAYLSFTTPLAVWLLRSFFETIPRDLEEAAMIDGASRFGAMIRVIFPLAGPGLAATAIFSFIAAWNEFLFALTFVKKEQLRTLPVALSAFVGRSQADWGLIMAASVLFTVPVVLFFLAVHRRLTTGMVAGSVTG